MEYIDVSSSNIRAVGYDEANSSMHVKFNSGSLYEYRNIPYYIYEGMLSATSVGRYFHSHVKNSFTYVQLQ